MLAFAGTNNDSVGWAAKGLRAIGAGAGAMEAATGGGFVMNIARCICKAVGALSLDDRALGGGTNGTVDMEC